MSPGFSCAQARPDQTAFFIVQGQLDCACRRREATTATVSSLVAANRRPPWPRPALRREAASAMPPAPQPEWLQSRSRAAVAARNLKVCAKYVSSARPSPCHACFIKKAPRVSSSRVEVSPLFVSSPRPKRLSPPGVYVSTICPRFPLFVTYLWLQEQPRPSASRCRRPLRGNAPPLPLHRLPSHVPL